MFRTMKYAIELFFWSLEMPTIFRDLSESWGGTSQDLHDKYEFEMAVWRARRPKRNPSGHGL